MAHAQRLFPFLPKDYIRRRRAVRRITNTLMIATLSAISAYFITRTSGGTGFPAPKLSANRVPAASPTVQPPAGTPSAGEASPSDYANGYDLEPGPYTVSEAADLLLHDANRGKELHVRVFFPTTPGSIRSSFFRTAPAARRIVAMALRAIGPVTAMSL